ncbi:hypothetical protein DF020_19395 [Burkholderia cenocepacia]|nr:hypothetical protein DF020_19395 [Burkholderia cenocepacia]
MPESLPEWTRTRLRGADCLHFADAGFHVKTLTAAAVAAAVLVPAIAEAHPHRVCHFEHHHHRVCHWVR